VCLVGNKNLPNLLETEEPPSATSASGGGGAAAGGGAVGEAASSSAAGRRPLSAMSDLSIGGRHLVGEVQVWWANCLHEHDR